MKDLFQYIVEKDDKYFGNVAFGDPDQEKGYPGLLKLQGKSVKDKEKNTKEEDQLLFAMKKWVDDADDIAHNALTKNFPLIKKGKDLFPSIFAPTQSDGTPVYRGLSDISKKMLTLLVKKTKQTDWIKLKGGVMMCTNPIKYTPRSNWQSWTYDPDVMEEFAENGYLITKQDRNFYFSPKALKVLFGKDEKEVVHHGKNFSSKVFIALNDYYYGKLLDMWDEMNKGKGDFATMGQKLLKKHK